MPVNATVENVFGTIGKSSTICTAQIVDPGAPILIRPYTGAILWTVQLIPQLFKSWRTKSTEGLSPWLV
jgi:hypothetical protein